MWISLRSQNEDSSTLKTLKKVCIFLHDSQNYSLIISIILSRISSCSISLCNVDSSQKSSQNTSAYPKSLYSSYCPSCVNRVETYLEEFYFCYSSRFSINESSSPFLSCSIKLINRLEEYLQNTKCRVW